MTASILSQLLDDKDFEQRDDLEDILNRSLEEFTPNEKENWLIRRTPPWIQVEYKLGTLPAQGWKIHLSATAISASDVLSSCLPLLLAEKVCFKFALNRTILRQLNAPHAPRTASGKFLTAYPADLDTFRRLITACDRATRGFKGPAILSDKAFSFESIAYYRFGGFRKNISYDIDGIAVYSLQDETGKFVPDVRGVSSRQPEWAIDPLNLSPLQTDSPPAQQRKASSVLLQGRYEVTHAIRHSNKGGVYLAIDRISGDKVVIKEARPHVASDYLDRDATDRLAREASNLRAMNKIGVTPRTLDLFQESGHLFLVLEWIPGKTLRDFIIEHRRENVIPLSRQRLRSLCIRVARLLERCHAGGFLIRDFTPNNIMLLPSGRLLLIDMEMACRRGDELPIGIGDGTPGYASPEQFARQPPSVQDDYFSLGAILFFLSTLRDPLFPAEEPPSQRFHERLRSYIGLFSEEWGISQVIVDLIVMCQSVDPRERYSSKQVLGALGNDRRSSALPPQRSSISSIHPISAEEISAQSYGLASQAIRHIARSFDLSSFERPAPSTCFGENSHPCNIQHGAAGIGLSLVTHAQVGRSDEHFDALRGLGKWVCQYLDRNPIAPPGLYFGLAGTAWFLLSCAELLEDADLKEQSLAIALDLPCNPAVADVTHGAAGIGLALLHFFHATGDARFLSKALALAEHLQSDFCFSQPGGIAWSRIKLASSQVDLGQVAYGFAHGIAGIAHFFLSLYLSLRTSSKAGDFLTIVQSATDTLLSAASRRGGVLYWPHGPTRLVYWPHWCNGSSGIGSFLLRFGVASQSRILVDIAIKAAQSIVRERWTSGISQCHGLAGNGEYLIDLFQFTRKPRFLEEARHLGKIIALHKIRRPNGIVFPDDTGFPTGLDFSVGSAGVASFLSRLAGNTTRLLMLDYLLTQMRPNTNVTPTGDLANVITVGERTYQVV